MTRKIPIILALVLMIACPSLALAETHFQMKCGKCGFESDVGIGGGISYENMTSFCVESKQFVYLTWKRGEKKPESIAKVWDSSTGKVIELYKFPGCSQLVMPLKLKKPPRSNNTILLEKWKKAKEIIEAGGKPSYFGPGPGFKHCPICGQASFHRYGPVWHDD